MPFNSRSVGILKVRHYRCVVLQHAQLEAVYETQSVISIKQHKRSAAALAETIRCQRSIELLRRTQSHHLTHLSSALQSPYQGPHGGVPILLWLRSDAKLGKPRLSYCDTHHCIPPQLRTLVEF